MLESANLFFRGPVWAAAAVVSSLATIVGIIGDDFWPWLSVGLIALVGAAFLTFHRNRIREQRQAESLPSRIDDLHREGLALVADLSQPVVPEEVKVGVWSISLDAPQERWDTADAFDQRVRELLTEGYPALLSDYARGFNEYRRQQRDWEAARAPDPEKDDRPDSVKLREFSEHMHRKPAQVVEASLEGLAVARHRL